MSEEQGPYDPGEYTVDEVKAYVTENPDQADEVLAAEQAGKNRSTLVEWLEGQGANAENAPAPVAQNDAEAEAQVEEALEAELQDVAGEWTSELPPSLAGIGLVGVRGLMFGTFTTQTGSVFSLAPGVAYAVSPEDAAELASAGAVYSEAP